MFISFNIKYDRSFFNFDVSVCLCVCLLGWGSFLVLFVTYYKDDDGDVADAAAAINTDVFQLMLPVVLLSSCY